MGTEWRQIATSVLFLSFIGVQAHVTQVCSATNSDRPGELIILIGTFHRPPRNQYHERQGELVIQSNHGTEHYGTLQDYCRIRRAPPTTTVATISEYLRFQDGELACKDAIHNGTSVFEEKTEVTCYAPHTDPYLRGHSMTVGVQGGESTYCLHYEYGLTHETDYALWDRTRVFYYTVFQGMSAGTHRLWIKNGSPYVHSGGQPPCSLDVTSKRFNGAEDPLGGPDLGDGQPTILQASVFDGKSACMSRSSIELLPNIDVASVRKCPNNASSGFTCSIICTTGFTPVGDIICRDGTWDTESFSCVPSFCSTPDTVENSIGNIMTISSVSGNKCGILTQAGVECDFKCSMTQLWGSGVQCDVNGTWKLTSEATPCVTSTPPHGTKNPTTFPTQSPTASPIINEENTTYLDGDGYYGSFGDGLVVNDKEDKERSDLRTGVLVGGTVVFFVLTSLSCCVMCCLMAICFIPPMHDEDKQDVEDEKKALKEQKSSDPLKNPENYMVAVHMPESYSWADIYGIFILVCLIPAMLVMFIVGAVLNVIPITLLELHRNFFLPRPLETYDRSKISSTAFIVLICILYLPLLLVAIAWSITVLAISIGLSFPWAICNATRTINSISKLASFVGAPGRNCDIHSLSDRYAREYGSIWSPGDLIIGFLGALDRQGFSEFFIAIPLMISVVPVVKLLFMANPFLYDLSEVSYINQWSIPLDANNDTKVNDEDVGFVLHNIQTHVSCCRLSDTNRSIVDAMPFAGHYPYPPEDRKSKTAAGVQYATGILSTLITHTTHVHDIPGYVPKSRNGSYGVYSVYLEAWNPWHHLVGYVEVNLRYDGRAEHPMWLLADKSSRIHSQRLKNLNDLFVKVMDGFARIYLRAQIKSHKEKPSA